VPLDAYGDPAGGSSSAAGSGSSRKPHGPSLGAARDLLDTIIGKPGRVDGSGAPAGHYTTPRSQGGTSP
jgi:hypothetical protein